MNELLIIKNQGWKKAILFILGFFLVYQPNLWGQSSAYIPTFIVILITILLVAFLTPGDTKLMAHNLNFFIIGTGLSVLYYLIRSMLAGTDARFFQNLVVVVNVLGLVVWLEVLRKYLGFRNDQVIGWLLWMMVLQCLIAVVMMLEPNLRAQILARTATNAADNQFIYTKRLYGLSSDYTFFTPIYHSIIGICAIHLGMTGQKKYYLFVPFCIFIIILNGRTGLATLFLGISILLGRRLFSNFRGVIQVLFVIVIGGCGVFWGIAVLRVLQPATYQWIMSGITDTVTFFQTGDKVGNYEQLAGTFLMTPEGMLPWLFGYGVRVYAGNKANISFATSDIGYVNDLFMGGIAYMSLLYGTFVSYLLYRLKFMNTSIRKSMLLVAMLSIFVVANYKGEVARSGLVLTSVIFLTYMFSTSEARGVAAND